MRPRPPWLGKYDEPILELYEKSELALPPAAVCFNLDWMGVATPAKSTVNRRLRKLADHGLLERVDEDAGYYALTEKGRDYLRGELEPGALS